MSNPKIKKIIAMATDPIYIGTGGFTIGRVDNTIVRDPITNIPKIPGSSIAGTWRYYVALELISSIKDKKPDFKSDECKDKSLKDKFNDCNWKEKPSRNWQKWKFNKIARIECAGQDETSKFEIEKIDAVNPETKKSGHCGHCIVCKAFGFSKRDKSSQGMLFFSDLNILFFPVYTRFGVKWITSFKILKENDILKDEVEEKSEIIYVDENLQDNTNYLNLGWLNLPYEKKDINIDLSKFDEDIKIDKEEIVIVPNNLISQIINSNLEVRTSVSIDPITGAAKEKALFTSEAIPRGTIFSGEVRIFKRDGDDSLPKIKDVIVALCQSKQYFETLGVGGMTTRGFGRLKVELK